MANRYVVGHNKATGEEISVIEGNALFKLKTGEDNKITTLLVNGFYGESENPLAKWQDLTPEFLAKHPEVALQLSTGSTDQIKQYAHLPSTVPPDTYVRRLQYELSTVHNILPDYVDWDMTKPIVQKLFRVAKVENDKNGVIKINDLKSLSEEAEDRADGRAIKFVSIENGALTIDLAGMLKYLEVTLARLNELSTSISDSVHTISKLQTPDSYTSRTHARFGYLAYMGISSALDTVSGYGNYVLMNTLQGLIKLSGELKEEITLLDLIKFASASYSVSKQFLQALNTDTEAMRTIFTEKIDTLVAIANTGTAHASKRLFQISDIYGYLNGLEPCPIDLDLVTQDFENQDRADMIKSIFTDYREFYQTEKNVLCCIIDNLLTISTVWYTLKA